MHKPISFLGQKVLTYEIANFFFKTTILGSSNYRNEKMDLLSQVEIGIIAGEKCKDFPKNGESPFLGVGIYIDSNVNFFFLLSFGKQSISVLMHRN